MQIKPIEKPPETYLCYLEWRNRKLRDDFERLPSESAFYEWKRWERIYYKAMREDKSPPPAQRPFAELPDYLNNDRYRFRPIVVAREFD